MTPRELAEHYERIERMALIGSWRWDPATETSWWSPGMHEIFGISPKDFDGRMSTLLDAALPDDRHILVEAAARFEKTGEPELLKYRILRPDGAIRHIWAFGEADQDEDGHAYMALGYVLDVSERARTESRLKQERDAAAAIGEERFRKLVRSAPVPAMLHAEDGSVLLINKRFTELTGYTRKEVPTILEWTDQAYGSGAGPVRAHIEKLFHLSGVADEGEFEITTKGGDRRIWVFSSSGLGALSDGRKVVLSMAHDVTQERAMDRERREYEQRVHRMQRLESLGVLAGGIAHDFNNILLAVIGNASVALEHEDASPPLRGIIEDMRRAAERAAALARDMLTYAGEQEPDRTQVSVDRHVEQLEALLRASVSHHHELTFEKGAGAASILIGANQLAQLLMNLVTNAAEAMDGPGGHIHVRTGVEQLARAQLDEHFLGEQASAGPYVYVEVEDDGRGMDHDTIDRLFEPFFSSKPEGRGLGMAVVMGILRTSGGVALLDSQPGRGTRIRACFPLLELESTVPLSSEAAPASVASASGRVILVVDDEEMVLLTVTRMLEHEGFAVEVADRGQQALRIVEDRGAELAAAIVDLTMPGMSGVELMAAIKARRPKLPVILVSGYSASSLPPQTASVRHDGFLSKPFRIDRLVDEVRRVLSGDD